MPRRTRIAALVAAGLLVAAACGTGAPPPPSANPSTPPVEPTPAAPDGRPVVIDTDVGPDDLMAIAYALSRADLDVRAITVSGTGLARCDDGARLVAGLAARLGRADLPVACGRETPLRGSHAFPDGWRDGVGFLDVDLPSGDATADETASSLLAEAAAGAGGSLELLLLGPHTNLAEALQEDPGLADRIAGITVMGGAVRSPGNVAVPGSPVDVNAEWNLYIDPYAVDVVFASGIPLILVPLDATNDVPYTVAFPRRLAPNRDAEAARFVYELVTRNAGALGDSFWDQLAAAVLVEPELVETAPLPIDVVTEEGKRSGATVVDPDGYEIVVARSADGAAFEREFIATLNGGRPVAAVPEPSVTFEVTFDGAACSVDGPEWIEPTWAGITIDNPSANRAAGVIVAFEDDDGWDRLAEDVREPIVEVPSYLRVALIAESEPGADGQADGPLDAGPHGILCVWLEETSDGFVQHAVPGVPLKVVP